MGQENHGFQDGEASTATFVEIADMTIDKDGNMFATDENRIRRITPQGKVTTIAGSVAGNNDGLGSVAKFSRANGLGVDAEGNLYVADSHDNRIRKVSKN